MKILIANLKHFYQCRALWYFYLLVAPFMFFFFFFFMMVKLRTSGSFIVFFIASFLVGLLTANLQRDVLTKPFSFCMPEHRDQSRLLIVGIGSVLGLLTGIAFLIKIFNSHGDGAAAATLPFWAVCFLAMMCYLLGVWFIFVPKNSAAFVCALLLVIGAQISMGTTLRVINYMIVSAPLLPVAAGIVTCGVAWKWLGDDSLARKHCGESFMSIGNSWNLAKKQKVAQEQALRRREDGSVVLSDHLEDFFLERMRNYRPFSVNRYVSGNLYNMLGKFLFPWRKTALLFPVSIIPIMGYVNGLIMGYKGGASGHDISDILFLVPAMTAVQLDLVPHRNLLLLAGRVEKYSSALVSGAIVVVLATVFAVMMTALSVPLSSVMPDIVVKGHTVAYHALHARGFYISLIFVPIALVIGTLFSGKSGPRFVFVAFVGVLMQLWINPRFAEIFNPLSLIGIPGVIILIAASWIGSVLVMRYYFRRQNLVGQGR